VQRQQLQEQQELQYWQQQQENHVNAIVQQDGQLWHPENGGYFEGYYDYVCNDGYQQSYSRW